jgi:Transglutaminase-like superfamily
MSSSRSSFPPRGRLSRLIEMRRERRALFVEALAELALAAFAIRFRPFRQCLRAGSLTLGTASQTAPQLLAGAVERAASMVPFRAKCFQQGLAFQRMARRRGIDARLHYGIATRRLGPVSRSSQPGNLHAHVWITVGGAGFLGYEQAPDFREVLQSPE